RSGPRGRPAVHGVYHQASRWLLHVRYVLHGLQDHEYSLRQGRRETVGGRLQRTRHASWLLLLAAGHAPSGVPRYIETGKGKLGRRTRAPRMASLFRLHAIATDRASDRLWSGRANLVRRFTSPGEVWRRSVLRPDPEAATSYPRE